MPAARILKRAVVTLTVVGVAGALAVLGTAGFVRSTAQPQTFSAEKVPPAPVALVLGAEIYPDGTPSPYLKGRLDLAQRLLETGKVKVILVSGDNGEEHYNEPDGMRNYLIRNGVPAGKVVADYAGFDTYDSCVRAKQIFGVDRLTVVTQGYHIPRAVATCRLVGVDAQGVGDYSARTQGATWRYGQLRELLANFKMMWDVGTRRTPILGSKETSVTEALR